MQIARVFFDVHMGKNFIGLTQLCKDAGFDIREKTEAYVVFVNSKHTKFKLFAGTDYLVYHDNKNKRFPLDAIRNLPSAFDSTGRFAFNKALEKTVREQLGIA